MDSKEQIIILGAGLAGLTTAYYLHKQGIPYRIIEGRDRPGGRIHTIRTESGSTIEMGATWFAPKHGHLMDLIHELKVPYQDQYTGTKVLYDYADPHRMVRVFELPAQSDEQYLFTHGTKSLIDALLSKVGDRSISTGQRVLSMDFQESVVQVKSDQGTFFGSQLVNTLPPNLLVNTVDIQPGLPTALRELAQQTHTWMGESIKVGLEFEEDYWRPTEIGTVLSQFGPAQELHDHQHEGADSRVLKGFIHPDLHPVGRHKRQEQVEEQMRMYFDALSVSPKYYEKDWQEDDFTFFPYPSALVPHQNNGHPYYRQTFMDGRLIFAGSETAQAFPGYLDGAVERAKQVAASLIKSFDSSRF